MHPYLFFLDGFPIRSYGLVISLSIFFAACVGYFLAKKEGRGEEKYIVDLGIYCGIAGLFGARLWDVFFFDWGYYSEHLTEVFNVWQGGMAIQGGVLFGVAAGVIYARRYKLDILHLLDTLAPAIVIGQSFGRCANLLNGDAFGAPTGSDFGILYPIGTLARRVYGNQPLWPAEVWEGQLDLVVFALLLLYQTRDHTKGRCFVLYVILYSTIRFCLEFLRGDYTSKVLIFMTSAQTTACIALVIALAVFIFLPIYNKKYGRRYKAKNRHKAPPV